MNQDVPPVEKSTSVLTENIPDEKNVAETDKFVESPGKSEEEKRVERNEALEAGARALTEKAEAFVDIANRFSSWVKSRAPYGGFNVGEKIEQSDEYRTIRGNVEILTVEIPGYLNLVQKIISSESTREDIERMQQTAIRAFEEIRNDMAKAQQSSKDLYGGILRLKKQIVDYHNGNETEDEEYLASLIPLIRDIHDRSHQLRNEFGRQQELIDSLS